MTRSELLDSRYATACGYHPLELQLFLENARKSLMNKTPRTVRVVPISASGHEILSETPTFVSSWRVRFVERRKGQRHDAAQFDGKSFSRKFVEDWVKDQPELKLVDKSPSIKEILDTFPD